MSKKNASPLRRQMIRQLELHRLSKHTVEAYLAAVEQLAHHYHRSPDQISHAQVCDFIHFLIVERKLATSTVNVRLAGLKFFYRYVVGQRNFQLEIPCKRPGRLPQPHSRSEVKRLIDSVTNRKHRVMLMTAYSSGVRVGELVRLGVRDIHSSRMLIHVRRGKGDKDRFTILSPRLLEELRRYWLEERPLKWLFPNRNGGPLSTKSIATAYYNAKQKAGVESGHGIHSLRHSFATHLLESGVDLITISRLLGHSALSTTAKYLHVTNRHVRNIHSPFDLLPTHDQARDEDH